MTSTTHSVHIQTWGCQMNAYDSLKIEGLFRKAGYNIIAQADNASVVVLNTCSIREKAHEKVYSALGRLSLLKKEALKRGREMRLIVVGCMAQAEGLEIKKRIPALDWVVGTQALHTLPNLLKQEEKKAQSVAAEQLDFATEEKLSIWTKTPTPLAKKVTALLSIQEGCSKFCTFCVVPYTRGEEVSRSVRDIIEEARELADQGICEITLLGQNVTAWHGAHNGRDYALCDLLEHLTTHPSLSSIVRWRYITGHPIDMTSAMMAAHKHLATLMPYIHVPLQAGDDGILKAMNRKHTAQEYLDMVEEMRSFCPDVALSSDFIVGFPGEKEEQFQATMDMVEKIQFARAFSFLYSIRPGTSASYIQESSEKTVTLKKHLQKLQSLLQKQQIEHNEKYIGQDVVVLVEGINKEGFFWGRTPHFQKVVLRDSRKFFPSAMASLMKVRITSADMMMEGEVEE